MIIGGDKNILVDTGEMSPILSKDREDAIGGIIYTFEKGLEKHDLTPQDIDIVIHTHLHMDHCENDYKCENAIFYIIPWITAIWKIILTILKKTTRLKSLKEMAKFWRVSVSNIRLFTQKEG